MKKTGLIVLFTLLIFTTGIKAQQSIYLWKDSIPGAIINAEYEAKCNAKSDSIRRNHITVPLLEIYEAPADKANGTSVIICPGGAYWLISVDLEGKQIAQWLNSIGITAFVLNYRLPSSEIMKDKSIGPLQDAQKAIRYVRRHCKKWSINPDKIGIMGFSAGGHLASTLSTHYKDSVYKAIDSTSARPDFSILLYPVISMENGITHKGSRINLLGENPSQDLVEKYSNERQITDNTPPAFLAHAMDDKGVSVENSINYALGLRKHHIPCELHIYQNGGHGFGIGTKGDTVKNWPQACEKWLESRGYLK